MVRRTYVDIYIDTYIRILYHQNTVKSPIFALKRRVLHQNSVKKVGLRLELGLGWLGLELELDQNSTEPTSLSATLPFAPNVCQFRNSSTSES